MRVALTGSTGFTGKFVAQALEDRGVSCIAIDADLRDTAALDAAVAETSFDRLIHLAAVAFAGGDDWERFYAVNQIGTFHLIDSVARHKPGARCVIASSAQVYGAGLEGLIPEDTVPRPANHYGLSKLAMETGSAFWKSKLDLVFTRPFNYTGAGQERRYLIPKIVDHFRRKAKTIELGNLWVKRDFGDVRSVAEAYAGLVLAEAVPPAVNICTGTVSSIQNIVDMLRDISGHSIEVRVNSQFVRESDPEILGGDVQLLRSTLPQWSPLPLRQTLEWMYAAQ